MLYDICTGTTVHVLCNLGNREGTVLARIRQSTMKWAEHSSFMQAINRYNPSTRQMSSLIVAEYI